MLTRSEKFTVIVRALILIVYIIGITLYCMFREMKQKALTALSNLRLFKQVPDDFSSTTANVNSITGHIFAVDGAPSLTPIPNEVVTGAIKRTLPIIRYGDLLSNCVDDEDTIKKERCVVCWECVERSDEIRDLPNCRHVFHRDCLDNWVEKGQITCPLCRSMLLPLLTNPWAVVLESNSSGSLIV